MPWSEISGQDKPVRLLRSGLARGSPHHAYLLTGPAGVGKDLLARLFAQAANCDAAQADARPCGTCESCRAVVRGTHADVVTLMPQSEAIARGALARADLEGAPSRDIRVDDVRALARRLSLAAFRGRRKIAILTPADALNERAQNALLKTLEEPPQDTTFLLVTAHPDSLLPTVRSRCARLTLGPLRPDTLVGLLLARGTSPAEATSRAARAEGSLGRALALGPEELEQRTQLLQSVEAALRSPDERDSLQLAEEHGEREAAEAVHAAIRGWLRDVLVLQAGADPGLLPGEVALEALAREVGERCAAPSLLRQEALCAEVGLALEQNGNGRLQLERLLLGLRLLREPAARAGRTPAQGGAARG